MYISVLPLRKVVMVMMDMVKYCHICCRWDKCIYFVRKTKFQVKFFNIFSKSALDTLGAIFVCPVRPVSGSVRPVHGVCRNCTSGVRVFAMPVFVPCCRSSSPCPFFCYFCLPADGFSGAVRRFGFTYCPCCRDSRGVVAAAPGRGRAAGGKSGAYSSASPYTSPRSASSE